ncbi:MAG: hypothetical protein ACLR6J_13685 [Parabacteroides merdae]
MVLDLYVSVVSILHGKEKKDAAIRNTQKYIDIQMPLFGAEKIGWKPGWRAAGRSQLLPNEQRHRHFYIDRSYSLHRDLSEDSSPSTSPKMAMLQISAQE